MEQTMPATRESILDRARAAMQSSEKPDLNIDLELASLHFTLPQRRLTKEDYNTQAKFTGFLLNPEWSMYARVDDTPKYLYASARTTSQAVRWNIQKNSENNCELWTTVGGTKMYFNWRNITGACKFYPSYDAMTLENWDANNGTFQIQQTDSGQQAGTWSVDDSEIYIRQNIVRKDWGFEIPDVAAFSADDRLIYSAYLKEFPAA